MKKRRAETTTKQVLWAILEYCAVAAAVIIIVWAVFDRSDAAEMLQMIRDVVCILVAFYVWKAKAENLNKYKLKDKITMNGTEDYTE